MIFAMKLYFMQKHIENLTLFGKFLSEHKTNELNALKTRAKVQNPWFTIENIEIALDSWVETLQGEAIKNWLQPYHTVQNPKTIGLIPAGNIPLVGLHDLLCVLASGNKVKIKYSSKDEALMKAAVTRLMQLYPDQITEVDTMKDIEGIIATGSDTSFKYFERYFGTIPNIFRKNRNSVAVLNGDESDEDLFQLGKDIFTYFGLGCRNVTHLIVPKGYSFYQFFEALLPFGDVIHHNKYNNNYSYNRAMYLMNKVPFLDNNFVMIQESEVLYSSIGVIHYHFVESQEEIEAYLKSLDNKIQCVVGKDYIPFGRSQKPSLNDYADGVDTMQFLTKL